MNKIEQIKAIVCEVSKPDEIVMQLTDIIHCLRDNQCASDYDLEDTWHEFKRNYVKLKDLIDQYIIEGES